MDIQEQNGKIYSAIREKWLDITPEERVRQKFVCRLVNHYGYQLNQMAEELQVSNSHRGLGKAKADIVIWKSPEDKTNKTNAFIVVECKADNITIKKEDYFQGCNYARWAGASFLVTSNEKETSFFRVNPQKIPTELEEITDIPLAADINNDKKIKELLSQLKTFERDEFANLLHKCHNIIRNNDKLSPEAAFDEISKILFIKIQHERNSTVGAKFSLEQFNKDEAVYEKNIKPALTNEKDKVPYMQYLFRRTKQAFEKDHLFDPNETIKIREYSFKQIVKELERYNLSNTSDDIKGIAFEKFLGTTFRGELGQFFTPRTVVDFMVKLLDPQEGEIVCDPCCGSGGFLINVFEYIRHKIEADIQKQKEKMREQYKNTPELYDKFSKELNKDLDVSDPQGRLFSLSRNCIYGTDANPRMARVSKMNMIMHGDGHGGVHHHDGLLNVNGIFEERFDVILTNPPFGTQVTDEVVITQEDLQNQQDIKKYIEKYGEEYKNRVLTTEDLNKSINKRFFIGSKLTEVLFIERCLNLLKKGGRMGIVLPEGVLNGANLQKCREFVEGKAKLLLITSIPQDVFVAAGATVKPSLLFFKKFTKAEENEYNTIKVDIDKELALKYQQQIDGLSENLSKKERSSKLKEIKTAKENEAKKLLKERFNYLIPVAEVKDAGITTTGQKSDNNELLIVLKEFKEFANSKNLWETPNKKTFLYKVQNEHLTKEEGQ